MGPGHGLDNAAEPVAWDLAKNDLYECVCAGGAAKSSKATAVLGISVSQGALQSPPPKGFPVGRRSLVCVGSGGELGSRAGLEDRERIPRLGVRPSAPGDGVGRRVHRGAHQSVPPSSRPGCRSPRGGARGPLRAERPRRGVVCGRCGLRDRRGDLAAPGGSVRGRPMSKRESAPAPAPPPGAPRPAPPPPGRPPGPSTPSAHHGCSRPAARLPGMRSLCAQRRRRNGL